MRRWLTSLWQGLRRASGEDAYERYLVHWHTHSHSGSESPLDRKTFYAQSLEHKWNGIRRCC